MSVRAEFENLRAESEYINRVAMLERETIAAHKRARQIQQIKRTQPLDDQILELMRRLPPAIRDRPWSMTELVNQLNGRYRDRPHAKHIGEALRRLGWQRIRLWTNGADGQRVWVRYTPETQSSTPINTFIFNPSSVWDRSPEL